MAERTFELAKANQQLKDKADNLKEANIALNVLLKKKTLSPITKHPPYHKKSKLSLSLYTYVPIVIS